MQLSFRPIRPEDDAAVAAIIRAVMPEFGAGGAGFAIHDPEVDHMAEAYAVPGAAYFVVEDARGRVLGGGGFAKLEGGEDGICELKKMYFLPLARGTGMGERLLRACLETARQAGYRAMYLETLTGMDAAMKLYAKVGFKPLCAPMGSTGHHGCDRWYAIDLHVGSTHRRIALDWALMKSPSDILESLLQQAQSPDWHGRNLNALRDSWIVGNINPDGPPYAFQFSNLDRIKADLRDLAMAIEEIARDSVHENGGSYTEGGHHDS